MKKTCFHAALGAGCALALAVMLAACQNPNGGGNGNSTDAADVDWTNYQTAGTYSIRVKNESNVDLIAFKSSLSAANMLGGVRKNEGDHGFKRNTALLNQNTDFSIIFITVDQYNAYKDNLSALESQPFTRIFAAYNATGTNDVPWIVSSSLGGNNSLVVQNMTSWNMELRLNSPRGTTLGYAPYQSVQTTLKMNDGSVYVFPVFKQYNAVRDEIVTIYPKAQDGLPVGNQFSFSGGNSITINASSYTGNQNGFSSGAAYLVIKNDSQQGITVQHGDIEQATATGLTTINAGDQRTFTILMPGSSGNYAPSDSFSGWKIVNMGSREKTIPAITSDSGSIMADYRYTVTVTGDWNGNLDQVTVSAPVKGDQVVTTDFGTPTTTQ